MRFKRPSWLFGKSRIEEPDNLRTEFPVDRDAVYSGRIGAERRKGLCKSSRTGRKENEMPRLRKYLQIGDVRQILRERNGVFCG